jgi:magnesium transporter
LATDGPRRYNRRMVTPRRNRRRLKPRIRQKTSIGAKPGTLSIAPDASPTTIRVMAYSQEKVIEQEIDDPHAIKDLLGHWPVLWVDVVGLANEDKLRAIAEVFKIHPLALEDIVHVHQRAKVDPYDNNLFCVLRIPDHSNAELTEQFSILLGKNYLVTFQERPEDCFGIIRTAIRNESSATRHGVQPDYLAYRLIDASIDAYFPVLEAIGDHLDRLDDRPIGGDSRPAFAELHATKRELLMLRRAIWPLRDALNELRRETTPFVTDAYDHAVQLIDLLESYRDIAGDVRDFFLSSISNRMNEVMKSLTLIATIFLPLTFIAGIYGMNFDPDAGPWNMPELRWRYGYIYSLVLMFVVGVGMYAYFKWRGYLARDPSHDHEHEHEHEHLKGHVHNSEARPAPKKS